MRIFLGALMLLIVSGDDEVINGTLGRSVLLPCNCSNRNLNKEFKWQMEQECLIYNNSTINTSCKSQAKVFVAENSSNCSLLLTNITANDQGKYRCMFYVDDMYKYSSISLNISAEPRCDKPAQIPNNADLLIHPSPGPEQTKYVMRYYKTIPIGVVFVLSLALWQRWKISRGVPRASEVEMDNFEC